MTMTGVPSPAFSSSKPVATPAPATSQAGGTSNCVPCFGLVTTFQPAMTGLASSPPRGFSAGDSAGWLGVWDAGVLEALTFLPSSSFALLDSSSSPSTTTPVITAAATTAVAATIAMIVVDFLFPSGGCGAPGG
jgi:hypothetical protein